MIVRHYLDPFTEINAIRRQINDVFGDITDTVTRTAWSPALRLVDQGNDYVLTAMFAGVDPSTLDIQVSSDTVTIAGERPAAEPQEETDVLYDDVRYGHFQRVINLPDAVQNNQVTADLNNGVLTLTLPKVVEAQNKVVKINLGQVKNTEDVAIGAVDTAVDTAVDEAVDKT